MGYNKKILILIILLSIPIVSAIEINTKDVWYPGKNSIEIKSDINDFLLIIKDTNNMVLNSYNSLEPQADGIYFIELMIPNNLKKGNYYIIFQGYENNTLQTQSKLIILEEKKESLFQNILRQIKEFLFGIQLLNKD